ncbi:MAG: hypothetical protein LBI18_08185 [Planctomycetaceae bacterium]|jgi:hypothetical protein|nr:hypothetical protein [Planctomycetaceae bacterium]
MKLLSFQTLSFFLLTVTIFSAIGCGHKTVPVSGIITYHGKPAPDIQVLFQPVSNAVEMSEAGIGLTDAFGRFELRSVISNQKGVEPGTYTIFLSWKDPNADPHPIDGVTKYHPTVYPDIAKGIQRGGLQFIVSPEGSVETNFELTDEPEGISDQYFE